MRDEEVLLNKNVDYLKNISQVQKEQIILNDKSNFDKLKKDCFEKRKSALQSFLKIKDSFPYKQVQNNFDKINEVIANQLTVEDVTFEKLLDDYKRFYENETIRINVTISSNLYLKIRRQEVKLNELLKEIIIGNNDVDIAKLINDLGIRNWVSEGLLFLKEGEDLQTCPFCQKETIDKNLIEKFESYFDENYKNKLLELENLKTNYITTISFLLQEIKNVSIEFNEKNVSSDLYDLTKTFFESNIKQIEEKIKNSNEKKRFNL